MGSFYYPTVLSRRGEIFYRKKNEGVNKIFFLLSVFRVKRGRQPKARGLTHTHTNKRRFFFFWEQPGKMTIRDLLKLVERLN